MLMILLLVLIILIIGCLWLRRFLRASKRNHTTSFKPVQPSPLRQKETEKSLEKAERKLTGNPNGKDGNELLKSGIARSKKQLHHIDTQEHQTKQALDEADRALASQPAIEHTAEDIGHQMDIDDQVDKRCETVQRAYLLPYSEEMTACKTKPARISNKEYMTGIRRLLGRLPWETDNRSVNATLRPLAQPRKIYREASFINKSDLSIQIKYPLRAKHMAESIKRVLSQYNHISKGNRGEYVVFSSLKKAGEHIPLGHVYYDVNLRFKYNGGRNYESFSRNQNQNDIVLVNKYGVFSFEVKNYHGDEIYINKDNRLTNGFYHSGEEYSYGNILQQIINHKKALYHDLRLRPRYVHCPLVLILRRGQHFDYSSAPIWLNVISQRRLGIYIKRVERALRKRPLSDSKVADVESILNRCQKQDLPFPHIMFTKDYDKCLGYLHGINAVYNLIKKSPIG